MKIIADVSVVLAWFFDEALKILKASGSSGLLVPALWWSELKNGILMGERRARKSAADSKTFLKLIHALPIETDDEPPHQACYAILQIGRRFGLTSYDATYVELALRKGATLATFDEGVRRFAPKLKVRLMPT